MINYLTSVNLTVMTTT